MAIKSDFVYPYSNEYKDLLKMCVTIGSNIAMEIISEERKSKSKGSKYDRRLRNTLLLLGKYRDFKVHIQDSIYNKNQMYENIAENDNMLIDILNDMESSDIDEDYIHIESIKKTKERTAIMLFHIENMLEHYKSICISKKNEYEKHWNIIYDLYISDENLDKSDIVDKYNIDRRTLYRHIEQAKRDLSILFFGIDGILKL